MKTIQASETIYIELMIPSYASAVMFLFYSCVEH